MTKLEMLERATQGGIQAGALDSVTKTRRDFWRAIADARETGVSVATIAQFAGMSQAAVRRVLADQAKRPWFQS